MEGSPDALTVADDTDSAVKDCLREVFGFDQFRSGQRQIIDDVLARRNVVAVMPTGSGKSLCYQLPAVLLAKGGAVTLVVSPLIALMKDQVDGLVGRGVAAAALTSHASSAEQAEILDRLRAGQLTTLFVAPERFASGRFRAVVREVADNIALFAVDEAHCISEWGHEFRPAYRALGEVIEEIGASRVIALTATATPEVREDIAVQLRLPDPAVHVHGFARPQLRLRVEQVSSKDDKTRQIVDRVVGRDGGVALVYAATRKNTEAYAQVLRDRGLKALAYHAGQADKVRTDVQERFMAGELDAICATNAFGMGVDKADVRLLIHADLPRSPEAYYQEIGRAGRDGAGADCVLLFRHADVRLHEFLIDSAFPPRELLRAVWTTLRDQPELGRDPALLRPVLPDRPSEGKIRPAIELLVKHGYLRHRELGLSAHQPTADSGYPKLDVDLLERRADVERSKLRKMVDYCYRLGCRHKYILDYFEDAEREQGGSKCNACDVCLGQAGGRALSDADHANAVGLLQLVGRLGGRFGRKRIAECAAGVDDDYRTQDLPERGVARGTSARELIDLLRALEAADLVAQSRGEYPTIVLTRGGKQVADDPDSLDPASIVLQPTSTKKRSRTKTRTSDELAADADLDSVVIDKLRTLRTKLASEKSVPPYVVFSNKTLEELARALPTTLEELSEVHGIGPSRLGRYGQDILAALSP